MQTLETLIDYLYFHWKMVMMILQDILLINITYREFNVLIDNKPVFDLPVKHKQKTYEKHWNLRNDGYITETIRLFASSKTLQTHWYRFVKTKNTTIPQQINFTGKFGEDDLDLLFRFISCNRII